MAKITITTDDGEVMGTLADGSPDEIGELGPTCLGNRARLLRVITEQVTEARRRDGRGADGAKVTPSNRPRRR